MRLFLFVPAVLIACDSDEGVKVHNSAPVVDITSHVDGDTVFASEVVSFRATVSDAESSASELSVQWSFGERVACPFTPPDSDGASTCEAVIEAGEETVSVEVRDPKNATGTDSVSLSIMVSDAPTVAITSPLATGSYYSDQLITFTAIIDDAEDEPADLSYQWESSIDGPLSITGEPESSGEIEGFLSLTEGQHAISLTVEDTSGKTTTESVIIDVGGDNNEPLCEITEPAAGTAYILGQNISFAGMATDEDINNALLSISWESNVDGVFDSTAANTAGELGFGYANLNAGSHTITLRVEDEAGGFCTDTVQLSVGTAPTLSLISPVDGTVYSLGDSVSFEATVADQEDIGSDIALSWVSDIDGEFSTQGSDSSGNISFGINTLSAGQHNLSVTATDTTGLTASNSLLVQINTPPSAPTVTITPDPATTNDALVATGSGSVDADGDNVSYTYSWTQNGNATSYNSSSVPASATAAGEVWQVRVTPNDGYVDGNYTEASITISNSSPSVSSVGISPSSAYNDEVLTCSAVASDADETLTPTYTWTINGVDYSGSSLDLATTGVMPNDVVLCTASVTDSAGESASSLASVSISNRDPVVSGTTISPSSVYTSTAVSCAASVSDADGENLVASYTWSVGGVNVGTGASLSLSNSIIGVGDRLLCEASVSDGYGGSHSDTASVVILNTAPTIDTVSIDNTTPQASDTLTCSVSGSDPDGETPTYSFAWTNTTTGATYSSTTTGLDAATLDLSAQAVSVSDAIACEVTASDSHGGNSTDAVSVSIVNSGPQFDSAVVISPSSAYTNTVLTCSATASDLNDGSLVPTYEWSVGNTVVGSGTSYTVSASDTDVGDQVVCTATATDSDGEVATSTASVTVENTAPTVSGVSISGGTYNDDTLTCSATVDDIDDNLDNIAYTWSSNNTPLGTGTSLDLSQLLVMPDDVIVCTVQAMDDNFESAEDSASLTLSNRAPTLTAATLSNSSPYADSTLTCSTSVSDADGESLTPSYEWTISNTVVGSASSLTLTPSIAAVGDTVTCTASVSDAYGGSDSTMATATVQNTEPTMSLVSISPSSNVTVTDLLTCSATGSDLNDGSLSPVYAWFNGTTGASLGSTASIQLDSSTASPDDLILCRVSFTDNNGATVNASTSVTIINTAPVFDVTAAITPSTGVVTGTIVTCTASASDVDDGTLNPTYEWSVGGVSVAAGTTYTVDANDTNIGESILCTATATDSDGEVATSTDSVTVENTAPTVVGVSISGGMYNDDTFTCQATANDPDESLSPTYTWTVDAVEVGTGSSIDLSNTAVQPQDTLLCTASVVDSSGISASDSSSIAILNRAPGAPSISISPAVPVGGQDDLTCTIDVASVDEDGQSVNYSYEWTVDGASTSYTTDTVPSADVGDLETWVCTVTPDDGIDFGAAASASVTTASGCTFGNTCDETLDLGNGFAIDFVHIEAGTFMMGSPTSEVGRNANEDQHQVTLTNDFMVSTTEVTQGMYSQLMGYDAHTYSTAYGVGSDYPVYYVNWHMAADFSNHLTQQHNSVHGTNLSECYSCSGSGTTSVSCSTSVTPIYDCTGYRLLTEAEWEYAARAGTTAAIWTPNGGGEIPSGYESSGGCNLNWTLSDGTILGDLAWFCGNNQSYNSSYLLGTKEVATKAPNDNGLYDMSGNLWEWTQDTYTFSLGTVATTDPIRENDSDRVIRGGGSNTYPFRLRPAGRYANASTDRLLSIGFRTGRTYLTKPSAPEVSLSPSSPTEGQDDLICTIDTDSIDPDGNPVTYSFAWTVDGAAYQGTPTTTTHSGDTIPAAETSGGEVWECTVTPNDGTEDGFTDAASVTIGSLCAFGDCDESLDLGNGVAIDFVHIEAGTFMMGSPTNEEGRTNNEDQHQVTLTNDFLVSTTEVTQGMFFELMGYQAYDGRSTSYGLGTDYPAYWVSWNMAADFSNQLTQQHNSVHGTNLTECYSCSGSGTTSVSCSTAVAPIYSCTGYRLLTEAEWEYAARAGTTAAFWTSNGGGNVPSGYSHGTYTLTDGFDLRTYAWYWPAYNSPYGSKEVATLIPNDNGLYGMSGNVWEWAHDKYTVSLGTGAVTDPVRENGVDRTNRGGDWNDGPGGIRSARRHNDTQTIRGNSVGFRTGRTSP